MEDVNGYLDLDLDLYLDPDWRMLMAALEKDTATRLKNWQRNSLICHRRLRAEEQATTSTLTLLSPS